MANLYENIISVAEAKKYLRLDEDFNEDDSDIERMIASALEYITKNSCCVSQRYLKMKAIHNTSIQQKNKHLVVVYPKDT